MAIDVSNLPNPYDFANPVNEPRLFAGRSQELQEIRYYLDHAQRAARPINLAVVGERASGKTSVLNMIDAEARKRECCVARADLDEGDVATQLGFFYKLFDSVLTAACELGAYGGLVGKTYDTYRDMVDAYEIPKDRAFCPFVFPMQYARAMGSENTGAALSDANFKRDMSAIQIELNRTIILLLDECDVLTRSRVHLEKLRNIFMNAAGFMLAFTGSPRLFPLIDDVFSPIIRQFKRIQVGPFETRDETKACIKKPLESIGINDPREVMTSETYRDVSEIHDLSGGRPYEIQLLCHSMFRRLQEGRAKRMELNVDVLDAVRRELEASQDVSLRPVANAVQRLSEAELRALRQLCMTSGRATFDQIWFTEKTFADEERWTEQTLRAYLQQFEEYGILKIDRGIIEFAGDDFDRIYCKYLARKKSIALVISERRYEALLRWRLQAFVRRSVKGLRPLPFSGLDDPNFSAIERVATVLTSAEQDEPIEFRVNSIADGLYWSSLDFRHAATFQAACVKLTSPWTSASQWYRCLNQSTASELPLEKLELVLAEPAARAAAHGGGIEVDIHDFPVVPPQQLSNRVEQSGDALLKGLYANLHDQEMRVAYLEQHDVAAAVLHGDLAYLYDPTAEVANNLGYIYLASDNLAKASVLLEAAAKPNDEAMPTQGLPQYNLGILKAKEGDFQGARDQLKLAIKKSQSTSEEVRSCSCLVVPKITAEKRQLEFEEVHGPDLLESARIALSVVQQVMSANGAPGGTDSLGAG